MDKLEVNQSQTHLDDYEVAKEADKIEKIRTYIREHHDEVMTAYEAWKLKNNK